MLYGLSSQDVYDVWGPAWLRHASSESKHNTIISVPNKYH